ncbi:hypothetical protein ACL6C3_08560 [Capilliphycus salinus ALCB114379]
MFFLLTIDRLLTVSPPMSIEYIAIAIFETLRDRSLRDNNIGFVGEVGFY